MPGNSFLRFQKSGQKIKGETMQQNYTADDGWLEITDWNWDVESDTSFTKGTGAAVGKAKPNNFSFTHAFDASSPVVLQNIVKGTHFDSMEVHMLKQVGDDTPKVYWVLQAGAVFVVKVSSKGSEDGTITQDVELVFKQVDIFYKPQGNLGALGNTSEFHWNIAAMTNTTDALTNMKGIG